MKQGVVESRWSGMRPLKRLLMRYKRDTRLESSGAFIMPQLPLLLLLIMRLWGKAGLLSYLIHLCVESCYNATLCVRSAATMRHFLYTAVS